MAQNSRYCKAYFVTRFREFSAWSEDVSNLKPKKETVEGKDTEVPRKELAPNDILYLHDNYTVTDGIFKDQNIVFNQPSPEWKTFCSEVLLFKIPEYQLETATPKQEETLQTDKPSQS